MKTGSFLRSTTKKQVKFLRKIGVNKGWFAILEGLIIASGATKEELEKVLKGILPDEKQDIVFVFQMKK